jgi:hypothetical protein
MNAAQKWILVVGLAAMGIAASFAPFRYSWHNEISELVDREKVFEGSYRAPLWSGEKFAEERMRAQHPFGDQFVPKLDHVELDVGRLGLTWAAIASVTAVAVLLAASKRKGTATT